jgi:radical SAM protein with 4Fe4S-binding SPASM domain
VSGPHRNRVIWVLNAACPSRCVYCDIESQRATRVLSAEQVERACREVLEAGFREVVFVGGEPFLSPELPVALRLLAGRCNVAVFTGGLPGFTDRVLALVAQGVERLVFSIDSGREASNDLIRGRKGITRDLLDLATALRERFPRLDLSLNTVVSRHNAHTLVDVWERMEPFRPDSWALTMVGDNFSGSPSEHMLDRAQVERHYLVEVPALARRLDARRAELVVLPVPFPFLRTRTPPRSWGDVAAQHRAELNREFDLFARGEYNRTFVERCGCPLVGVDVSIGVGGEVYPCSQAPALQPAYVVGNLKDASLSDVLAGEALKKFGADLPHAPCSRCWAPSNVERGRLAQIVRGAAS